VRVCQNPFIEIPFADSSFDAVVSTYAFHHLSDQAKRKAIVEMKRVLRDGGRIAIGDVMFANQIALQQALATYEWLEQEYFVTIDTLAEMLAEEGLTMEAEQVSKVAWVIWAVKQKDKILER